MTSMQQVEVIEEVSKANSSAGWCLMIGCDSGLYSSFLEDDVARELYPRLDMVQAGWVAPVGTMKKVSGGYVVNGRWAFGSGSHNADVIGGGCYLINDQGERVLDEEGNPSWRMALAPSSQYHILDTWYTSGLKGTGSHDYEARDLFVPDEHTFSFMEPAKRPGTLYSRNDTFLRKMPAIPLGVARRAIDYAVDVLQGKTDIVTQTPYRDMAIVQVTISEAEILVSSARAYLMSSLEAQWRRMDAGEPLTREERKDVALSRLNGFHASRKAVQLLYDLVGGSAIYTTKHPLDGYLRDINTACQHMVAQTRIKEWTGKFMMGGEVTWPFL